MKYTLSTIMIILLLTVSRYNAVAQSLGYSGSLCAGSSINIYIAGGSPCGNANVSSQSNWYISPSPTSVSYIQSNGYYNQIQVSWATAVSVTVRATYTCSANGSSGTTSNLNFTLSSPVTPAVSLVFGSSSTTCQGSGSITLNASPTNGGSSPSYSFYIDGGIVYNGYSSSYTYTTNSLSAGTHNAYVTMNSSLACTTPSSSATSSTLSFSVQAKSTYTATLYNPGSVCSGSPNFNTSVNVTGGVGTLSYQWFKNNSAVTTTSVNYYTYSNVSNGDQVFCRVTSDYWCVNSPVDTSPVTISVITSTTPTASVQVPKLNYCENEVITFTAASSNIGGSSTYQWYLNGSLLSNTTSSISLTAKTTNLSGYFYSGSTVSVTINGLSGSCLTTTSASGSLASPPVVITAYPTASVSPAGTAIICSTCSQTFTATTGSGYTYQWKKNGTALSGANASTYTTNQPGAYSVDVSVNSCVTTSAGTTLQINTLPVVNAGADQSLVIPLSSVILTGLATAANGTIASYLWTQTSGPTVTLSGASTSTLTLTNVVTGTYSYSLKATDTFGDFSTDNVNVVINYPPNNYNYVREQSVQVSGITSYASVMALPVGSRKETTTYIDGLGRTSQSIITKGSPLQNDIVQVQAYDEYGREKKKYLPYVSAETNGWYKLNPLGAADSYTTSPHYLFYNNGTADKIIDNTRPFSETVFEPSPLNRPDKDYGPGIEWYTASKQVKHQYLINDHGTGAGQEKVINWTVDATGNPLRSTVNSGYYESSQLHINSTLDEQGNEVREYVDKEGKVILKKIQYVASPVPSNANDWAQTYYIYDDMDRLRCVLQPELVKTIAASDTSVPDATQLANFAFLYKYDARGRVIRKRVPGADWVYSVYDVRDRLLLTQDGNQRIASQWSFTRYDIQNRPVVTGIYTHTAAIDEGAMSTLLASTALYETYTGAAESHGYSASMYSTLAATGFEVLTVLYYDNYSFKSLINNDEFDYKYDRYTDQYKYDATSISFPWLNGKSTGSKVKVLGQSAYLWNVSYYDDRYRVVQATSSHTRSGVNRVTNVYDFEGKVLKSKTEHTSDVTSATITHRFIYDHVARLKKTFYSLNNRPEVLLARNEYNELGQLVTRKLHAASDYDIGQPGVTYIPSVINTSQYANERMMIARNTITLLPGFQTGGSTFTARIEYPWSSEDPEPANSAYAQVVDYRYNIRGWLTRINNSDLAPDGATDKKDYFGMNLLYEQSDADLGNTVQYSGNVSGVKWNNFLGEGTVKQKGIAYTYDLLNRLQTTAFKQKTTAWAAPANSAFAETGFQYDRNGNITALQRNDGRTTGWMDNLTYTYTTGNRLARVTDSGDAFKGFIDGTNTGDDYTYDANGNMTTDQNKGITGNISYNYLNLPVVVARAGNTIQYTYDATGRKLAQVTTFGTDQKKVDYIGEFQYENNVLQSVATEEGRILLAGTRLIYTDHGESTATATAVNSSVSVLTQNDDKYLKAEAAGTTTGTGVSSIGGVIYVQAGERYKVRLKGYRDSGINSNSSPAYLMVKASGTAIGAGAQLPQDKINEAWVEETVTIPAGATQLTVDVRWSSVASGEALYINELEITQLLAQEPEYQYHLKDHLGNVRITFTTKDETEAARATLETAAATTEQSQFLRYNNARKVQSPLFDHTNGTATGYAERLSGSANEKYGIARSISVMPGDTINAEVYAKYIDTNSSNWTSALNTLLTQIANGTTTAGTVIDGAGYSSSTSSFTLGGLIDKSGANSIGPKAYLNWLVFDRNYVLLNGGYKKMSDVAKEYGQDVAHEYLSSPDIIITEPGYVYIYLSNEESTPVEAYFDDFKVTHTKSRVVQAQDYFAFGLTYNSYQRENGITNDYLYNGKEQQDELNLAWLDYGARMYMPEIGRWGVIDPLAETSRRWSPYNYAYDNPIRFIDPDGMMADDFGNRTYDGFVGIGDLAQDSGGDDTDPKEKKAKGGENANHEGKSKENESQKTNTGIRIFGPSNCEVPIITIKSEEIDYDIHVDNNGIEILRQIDPITNAPIPREIQAKRLDHWLNEAYHGMSGHDASVASIGVDASAIGGAFFSIDFVHFNTGDSKNQAHMYYTIGSGGGWLQGAAVTMGHIDANANTVFNSSTIPGPGRMMNTGIGIYAVGMFTNSPPTYRGTVAGVGIGDPGTAMYKTETTWVKRIK